MVPMDTSSIYSQTLSVLDQTELAMTSVEGSKLIQAASPTEHHRAVRLLLDVHQARLALGNATLQSIVEKLRANEQGLRTGTAAVQSAIKSFSALTNVLDAVNTLIGVVSQIVPMI